jgi:hypothetical protein
MEFASLPLACVPKMGVGIVAMLLLMVRTGKGSDPGVR